MVVFDIDGMVLPDLLGVVSVEGNDEILFGRWIMIVTVFVGSCRVRFGCWTEVDFDWFV